MADVASDSGKIVRDIGEKSTPGSTAAGAGNVISGNLRHGVNVSAASVNNRILENSIFANTGLGIDLNNDGLTANDVNDPDTGPNNKQNFPVMTSVVLSTPYLNVTYAVPSIAPNSTFPIRVEFFIADAAANQEGKTFLGSHSYTTPGTEIATIPAGSAVLGTKIVATATDSNGTGNTSEFSANRAVTSSLLAAGGAAPITASVPAALTSAQLAPIVSAAILRLSAQGLAASQLRQLSSVTFSIADLPGTTLGQATSNAITLDANAAGYCWFVDPTPFEDREFTNPKSQISNLKSIDLLTAVMHELGHTLGRDDLHDHGTEDDLMYEALAIGTRRTSLSAVDNVLAGQ